MSEIVGLNTTFDSPNYHGDLFLRGRADHPFLSAIGGLTNGVKVVHDTRFGWQTVDLRNPAVRARLEGADAPDGSARKRTNAHNVVQIVHEAVETSYTRQAANGKYATGDIGSGSANQVTDEHSFQVQLAVTQAARDLNFAFLNGTYAEPADNTAPRRTRGIRAAIETNVTAVAGALTKETVLDSMQDAWENGGLREDETRTVVTNAGGKRSLSKLFITDAGYQEQSRTVGGVNVTTIETDFGRLNIMLEPSMPTDELIVVSLEQCRPVALGFDKGILFVEPIAKTGAATKDQLYGEFGLEYGNELAHAKLTGIDFAATLDA